MTGNQEGFTKFRFVSCHTGAVTDGYILTTEHLNGLSLTEISKLLPMNESLKTEILQRSPSFKTWAEAFDYKFPIIT